MAQTCRVYPDRPAPAARSNALLRLILASAVLLGVLFAVLRLCWGTGSVLGGAPWFVPMAHGFMVLAALSMAFLALGRYDVLHDSASYRIGVGCAVTGLGTLFYVLAWPGLMPGGQGIIARLPNTAGWIITLTQAALGGCLLAAALPAQPAEPALGRRWRWLWSLAAWLATATGVGILIIAFETRLPMLVGEVGAFTPLLLACQGVLLLLVGTGAVLSTCRYRSTGDPLLGYLALTQLAMCYAQLAVALGRQRYDPWWFLGRVVGAGGVLAAMFGLLLEHVRLYRREQEKTRQLEATMAERQQAEEALRQSEERFRLLVEQAVDGIFVSDAQGRYLDVNSAGCQMLGYTREEILARSIADVIAQEELPRLAPEVSRFAGGQVVRSEWRFRRKDGSLFFGEVVGRRLPDGRLQGILRDIIERKLAEQALAQAKAAAESANAAKDEFLAVLSHELRTPLTPVLLTAALLEQRQDLPADMQADVQTIRRNVQLEARIIDDLLDLARISRGKLRFDMQSTDLHLLIRSAAEICSHGQGAKIVLDLSAQRHQVQGDATRLQQVFWNLLTNARKFTPAGGTITARTQDLPDGRVAVSISDTGAGIEPEFLPRLFSAFEQGHAGKEPRFGGLGLGLAISKAIIDAHSGTIHASSPGKGLGTTFTITLAATMASPEPQPPAPSAPQRQIPSLRILLVEDHESTLKLLRRLVEGLGHEVQTASTVESAKQMAQSRPFDLVISDLGLPDGTGHALMQWLKQRYDLKGIALSGYGMEGDIARSREAGFELHLVKPVDLQKLEAAIARVGS